MASLGKSDLVKIRIQLPESPTVCTGKEKTWKARKIFEYVQHEVWHILHQMGEVGKVWKNKLIQASLEPISRGKKHQHGKQLK